MAGQRWVREFTLKCSRYQTWCCETFRPACQRSSRPAGANERFFFRQVASRELRIPPSKVYISETTTSTVPNTFPSAASFGTDANGMAVKAKSCF